MTFTIRSALAYDLALLLFRPLAYAEAGAEVWNVPGIPASRQSAIRGTSL
jgi:hypothetical protein